MKAGSIAGVVVGPDDRPIANANAMVVAGPSHPDIAAASDKRGRFSLTGLSPGRYTVEVGATGWKARRAIVVVQAGGSAHAQFRLQPFGNTDSIEELPGDPIVRAPRQEEGSIPELPGDVEPEIPIPEQTSRAKRRPRSSQ